VKAERWSAWSLAEAFHLAHAADFVVAIDLLDEEEHTADVLADKAAVDVGLLAPLLELLACRTDLVVRGKRGFKKGHGLRPVEQAVIDQYVGAYGPNAAALPELLAGSCRGRDLVDRDRHAVAFGRAPGPGSALLPGLLGQLGLGRVLDLGCGTGELLVDLAGRDAGFQGWGVDANPAMVRAAKERLRASPTARDQVRFYVGDVTRPELGIPKDVARAASTVVAASLMNELFHPDPTTAVRWLGALVETIPGRLLIVVDYYGVLGHVAEPPPRQALHDWVQLITNQGVPPPDLDAWEAVYRAAGCSLLHAIQDAKAGAFIHLVRLAAQPS
jgi:SAM-dependent methyltransferase